MIGWGSHITESWCWGGQKYYIPQSISLSLSFTKACMPLNSRPSSPRLLFSLLFYCFPVFLPAHSAKVPMLHGDLKSANVLVDRGYGAKVSFSRYRTPSCSLHPLHASSLPCLLLISTHILSVLISLVRNPPASGMLAPISLHS
jgi:hypothetical protein